MPVLNSQLAPGLVQEIINIVKEALLDGDFPARRFLYHDFNRLTGTASASDQLLRQFAIPAGSLQIGQRIRIQHMMSKSGATDAITAIRLRIGTTGTASDTSIYNFTTFAAANRSLGLSTDLSVNSATVLRQAGHNIAQGLETGSVSSAVQPVDFTIGVHATTPIFISLFCTMAGTTDIPTSDNFTLEVTSGGL